MTQALLVLDVNNDIVNAKGKFGATSGIAAHADSRRTAEKMSTAVSSARAAGDVVRWCVPGPELQQSFGLEPSDEWGASIDVDWGMPTADETVYKKLAVDAFTDTKLEDDLKALGVDTILLGGVATSRVVLGTAAEGVARGFKVKVLEDCCSDLNDEGHKTAIASMAAEVEVTESTKIWR